MKVTIIGGGSWGTTLAQVLSDNHHHSLIYDVNEEHVKKINHNRHPFFDITLPKNVTATMDLKKALDFSNIILLAVPTKYLRDVLKNINSLLTVKKSFINVSKGIEPDTFKMINEVVYEMIDKEYLENYATLSGPSHAEEVILRRLTVLVASGNNAKFTKKVQTLFSNKEYLKIYRSSDLIGAEIAGSVKNAIAIISGIIAAKNLGENARAAFLSRSLVELSRIVQKMGGKKETAFGLTGVGDLIVTATSDNSRNYTAGKKIGSGVDLDKVIRESVQTVEGIRSLQAFYSYGKKYNVELPIINQAYNFIFNQEDFNKCIQNLLDRDLHEEII